jgi:tetratricopeptide (TPR) repeat protein
MDRKILVFYSKCKNELYLSHVSNSTSYDFYFDDDYDIFDDLVINNHESAIRKLKTLAKNSTLTYSLKKIYHNIGVLCIITNNKSKLLKYFNKAMELNNYTSHATLGHYYFVKKNYDEARKYFEKYQQLTNQEYSGGLARLYMKFKDYDNALKHYKFCAKRNNPVAMCELANYYDKNKMHGKAKKYYDKAKEYSCVFVNHLLALYHQKNKNYETMFTYLQKNIEWNCPHSMGTLGNFYRLQNSQIEESTQLILRCEVDSLSFNSFAELAEKYLIMAINMGSVYSMNELGLLYLNQKRTGGALKYFHMALECKSGFAALKIGNHYENIDDHENTIKYYQLSMQFGRGKTRNTLGYYYNNKKMFLEEVKLAVEYMNKLDCKCIFRNKCNFNCPETKDKAKEMQKQLNVCLGKDVHNFTLYNTHEDYFTMLQVARRYLNTKTLKVLNDYLCIRYHDVNETEVNENENKMDECQVCLTETNKTLQLYCCHKICYLCYPPLCYCPSCNYAI